MAEALPDPSAQVGLASLLQSAKSDDATILLERALQAEEDGRPLLCSTLVRQALFCDPGNTALLKAGSEYAEPLIDDALEVLARKRPGRRGARKALAAKDIQRLREAELHKALFDTSHVLRPLASDVLAAAQVRALLPAVEDPALDDLPDEAAQLARGWLRVADFRLGFDMHIYLESADLEAAAAEVGDIDHLPDYRLAIIDSLLETRSRELTHELYGSSVFHAAREKVADLAGSRPSRPVIVVSHLGWLNLQVKRLSDGKPGWVGGAHSRGECIVLCPEDCRKVLGGVTPHALVHELVHDTQFEEGRLASSTISFNRELPASRQGKAAPEVIVRDLELSICEGATEVLAVEAGGDYKGRPVSRFDLYPVESAVLEGARQAARELDRAEDLALLVSRRPSWPAGNAPSHRGFVKAFAEALYEPGGHPENLPDLLKDRLAAVSAQVSAGASPESLLDAEKAFWLKSAS